MNLLIKQWIYSWKRNISKKKKPVKKETYFHSFENKQVVIAIFLTGSFVFMNGFHSQFKAGKMNSTHSVPGFSNPNQKVHGLFHFYNAGIYKKDQNQLKKHLSLGFQNRKPQKTDFLY